MTARPALWACGLLGLAAPLFLFPTPLSSPSLGLVPLVLVYLTYQRVSWRSPLNGAILGLALMLGVSLYATYSLAVSLPKISGLLWGLGWYFAALAYAHTSRRALAYSLTAYLGLGNCIALLGLLDTRWVNKFAELARLSAFLPTLGLGLPGAPAGLHPNELAGVLLWFAPLALSLSLLAWPALIRHWGWGRAWLLGGLLGFSAVGQTGVLVLTQSRSGLMGLGTALAVILALSLVRAPGGKLLLVGGLVGGLALLSIFFAPLRQFFLTDASALGFDARLEIWSRAIYAIQDFGPLGMGLNTFRVLVHWLYPLTLVAPGQDFAHAHNLWLQTALDLGLPGLVAYVALWAGLVALLGQTSVRAAGWPRAVSGGLLAALAGSLVYSLLDAVTLGARPGVAWWLLAALAVATWQTAGQPLPAVSVK